MYIFSSGNHIKLHCSKAHLYHEQFEPSYSLSEWVNMIFSGVLKLYTVCLQLQYAVSLNFVACSAPQKF